MAKYYTITNSTAHKTLADRAVIADDSASRRKGWLGKDSVAAGEAIWITPCSAIHSFFMRFSIDAVFVDRQLRVVGIRQNMRPYKIAAFWAAHSVIEFPAGLISSSKLAVGDKLAVDAA